MKNVLDNFQTLLENIDNYRNRLLYRFIKPYWPRSILPNHITWIRVVVSLVLFILLFWFKIEDKALILSLFCLGLITDLADGPVARGTNNVTEFGAMLDASADKMLILPIAFYSLFPHHKWLLLAIIILELLSAMTAIFYKTKEKYMESNIFAKTKMFLLSIVFVAILILWPDSPPSFFIYVLWVSMFFSILSIIDKLFELNSKGHITNKIINRSINKLGK